MKRNFYRFIFNESPQNEFIFQKEFLLKKEFETAQNLKEKINLPGIPSPLIHSFFRIGV